MEYKYTSYDMGARFWGYVYTKDAYGNIQYLAMGGSVATGTFYAITTPSKAWAYGNWYFDSEGNLYNSVIEQDTTYKVMEVMLFFLTMTDQLSTENVSLPVQATLHRPTL